MTRAEVVELMSDLRALWPSFGRGLTREQVRTLTSYWAEALSREPAADIHAGLVLHLRRCSFAPAPAELIEAASEAGRKGSLLRLAANRAPERDNIILLERTGTDE